MDKYIQKKPTNKNVKKKNSNTSTPIIKSSKTLALNMNDPNAATNQ